MIHPSLVRKRSEGAEVCPRFTVAMRFGRTTPCSTKVGLLKATAVRRDPPPAFLAGPRLLTPHERGQRPEGGEGGGAAIHPRHRGAVRLLGRAGEIGRAAHDL